MNAPVASKSLEKLFSPSLHMTLYLKLAKTLLLPFQSIPKQKSFVLLYYVSKYEMKNFNCPLLCVFTVDFVISV